MASALNIVVEHEPLRHRFVAHIDDAIAVLEYTEAGEHTLDYYRTYVPQSLRGKGIASALAASALEHALERGFGVVPSCPFVAKFIERHPKYHALRRPRA